MFMHVTKMLPLTEAKHLGIDFIIKSFVHMHIRVTLKLKQSH